MHVAYSQRRSTDPSSPGVSLAQRHRLGVAVAGAAAVLAAAALLNWRLSEKARQNNPPHGRFIDVDGVQLHYVDRGEGRPLVLFHGNGSMIEDFESSGLIELLVGNYRVVVFDRPGFGHSERPRNVVWTPEAQAILFKKALDQLGIPRAIVLGHSWGASVALALAKRYPHVVDALVLASGYYFPTVRPDAAMSSAAAMPVIGDLLSFTISPLVSRLIWPALLRKLFGPGPVPKKFAGFPAEMAFRPTQMRASAAEAAMMIPCALASSKTYGDIDMPTVIIAGEEDRVIDFDRQSARLHREIKQSRLHRITGAGHMIHHSATSEVVAAIDEAAALRMQ